MNLSSFRRINRHSTVRQCGMTLIEVLIAMLIGIFLLFGLTDIFSSMIKSYKAQTQLVQLQNNQTLALNVIGNIIQSAGYFPNPLTTAPSAGMPAETPPALPTTIVAQPSQTIGTTPNLSVTFNSLESVFGGSLYANGPDTVMVRAAGPTVCTGSTPCPMDCTGNPITNALTVSALTVSNGYLLCSTSSTPLGSTSWGHWQNWQILLSGVNSMNVWYGVKTGTTMQYLTAANMLSANWSEVVSIRVTLAFSNPLNSANPISFTRVFGLMGSLQGT